MISWILLDVDAPHPHDRRSAPLLKYAKVNVSCRKDASTVPCELAAYQAPNPLDGILHCYQLLVVGHNIPVDVAVESERLVAEARERWDYKGFMRRWGMTTMHQKFFMI